jgi:hypothetical protein
VISGVLPPSDPAGRRGSWESRAYAVSFLVEVHMGAQASAIALLMVGMFHGQDVPDDAAKGGWFALVNTGEMAL